MAVPKHSAWLAQRKGSDAISAYDLKVLRRSGPQTVTFDVNTNTLEYYELDGRGRRKHNKPSPIVFKIDSEGEYLFSEVTDAGAAHFRQRNARRLKDGSINPHRVTAGDGRQDDGEEETAEDDDESGAQTTGTGSTSQEDSDAPPEPADAAEPMDVDPATFVSSSATARGHTTSSTPQHAGAGSTTGPSASAAATQALRNVFEGSDSELSSIEDSEPDDETLSSPVKAASPLPSVPKRPGGTSPSVAAGPSGTAPSRQRSPSYSSGSGESDDDDGNRLKTKGSGAPSDAEDYKPEAPRPTKVKLKLPLEAEAPPPRKTTTTAKSAGKESKTGGKAQPRPSGAAKAKDKGRSRDESEAGPSRPPKPVRINREVPSTARPTLPPKEPPSQSTTPSSSKLVTDRERSTAEASGSTKPKKIVLLKQPVASAASGSATSPRTETPSGKAKSKESSRTPSTSAASPRPAKSSKSAASAAASNDDAHRPSVKSKLSASVSVGPPVAEAPASSLAPAAADASSVPAKRSRASSPAPPADGPSSSKTDLDDALAPRKKRSRPSLSPGSSFVAADEVRPSGAPSPASVDLGDKPSKKAKASVPSTPATATEVAPVASAPAVDLELSAAALPKVTASGNAKPSVKSSPFTARPAAAISASPAPESAAQAKRKPETLLKKAVIGGSSGPSTPTTSKIPRPGPAPTSTGSKDLVAELLGGTIEPTASSLSQPRSASSIRVQLSAKEQADLEQMRKEHEAEMAEFLALPGMARPLDMEHQGHVIRARQNAIRRDFDKHDDAVNAYDKALQKFRYSGGGPGYEPSRPHPGNPPPPWTKHVPTFPHETGSLCGRLIACMDDRREESEGGRLPFPRNKAEAVNGDYVWVEEMEGKWDDADAVAAYLADPACFPPAT